MRFRVRTTALSAVLTLGGLMIVGPSAQAQCNDLTISAGLTGSLWEPAMTP
jgi:hypothetical protein